MAALIGRGLAACRTGVLPPWNAVQCIALRTFSVAPKPTNTFKGFAEQLEANLPPAADEQQASASAAVDPVPVKDSKPSKKPNNKKAKDGKKKAHPTKTSQTALVSKSLSKHDKFTIQVKKPLTFQGQLESFLTRVGDIGEPEVSKAVDKAVEKAFVEHEKGREKKGARGRLLHQLADPGDDVIDWDSAMAAIRKAEEAAPSVKVNMAELQEKTAVLNPTFSLAKVIDECPTLQRLVDLGVDLSKWERGEGGLDNAGMALGLDFAKDVAPRLRFLVDHGVQPSNLGHLLTENPDLFRVDLSDMKVRVEYLSWRKFSANSIAAILNSCPEWLNFSVADVDRRLGYFQRAFDLSGNAVRQLATSHPDLVIWSGVHISIDRVRIVLADDLEFDKAEVKEILMRAPEVYMQWDEDAVRETHAVVKEMYNKQVVLHFPEILAAPKNELRARHAFLKFLGKNQYDPKKPNYISPKAIWQTSDKEFCSEVVKVPIDMFNKFLLTV